MEAPIGSTIETEKMIVECWKYVCKIPVIWFLRKRSKCFLKSERILFQWNQPRGSKYPVFKDSGPKYH